MSPTSRQSIPRWARAGAIAAIVVAGIGVVGSFSAPSGAQQATPPTVVSDGPLDVRDAAVGDRSLVMSDDGAVVAYDSGAETSANRVVVRDRVLQTTALDDVGARPGLSADGCAVAFSTTAGSGGTVTTTLSAHDLCTSDPVEVVAEAAGTTSVPPALSADGAVVVWSPNGTIARHADTGSGFSPDATFAPSIPAGHVVGPNLDVSADGDVVAFEVLPDGGTTAQTEVWVWDDASSTATVVGGAGSHRPSVSGDGRLVAFESSDVTLADGAAPATPFVAVHDRDRDEAVIIAEEAWRPSLSSDGHHLAYRQVDDLLVAWWGSGEPFGSIGLRSLGRTLVADDDDATAAPLAALSAHGRWTVFDGDAGATLTADDADDTGTFVWALEERPAGGGDPVALGTVTSGDVLDTTVTITNESSAGAPLDGEVLVDSPFSVVSTDCLSPSVDDVFVLHPGASCQVRVRALTSAAGAITADVTYPVAGDPAAALSVAITATVVAPTTTVPPPPSTAPVAPTSTPEATLPVGTAPSRPPVFTIPQRPGFPSSGGGSSSSGSSGSSGSTGSSDSTGTTTAVPPLPTFDPPAFEFAPTIVDAGRRSATITLHNFTPDAISVVDVAIDPASAAAASYSVEASACIGTTLPGGATCPVEVTFAPVDTGDLVSAVLASLEDGTLVRGELTGLGAEPPVLEVVPGVASTGQVVSLLGAGFPAGAIVEVSWEGSGELAVVEISDAGELAHTMVVFPHTLRGPSTVTVLGQDGLFADVHADFLVTSTSGRLGSLVMRDLSPVRS